MHNIHQDPDVKLYRLQRAEINKVQQAFGISDIKRSFRAMNLPPNNFPNIAGAF